tara:strand:+ start:3606 stop:4142 length:537 start_codon:yes stop_codon:yes gene_type:complete
MKKSIKKFSFIILFLMICSCKNEKTLQEYLVESQEKTGFIAVDVPTSFLQLKSEDVSDDLKITLKSIRKISVVALPIKGNEEMYDEEKAKLKSIFKDNDEYKSLMTIRVKGVHSTIFYKGNTASIDEAIVFGYGKKVGVGVARLLGNKMNPAKIIEMMSSVKIDTENLNLEQFSTIFN